MVAYPVVSVYPQGILYRAFFFQRYATLFPGKWPMIVASAAAFALLHIIFRNSLAVALIGGNGAGAGKPIGIPLAGLGNCPVFGAEINPAGAECRDGGPTSWMAWSALLG